MKASDIFIRCLENAFTAGGVHLIGLAVDYSENTRILFEEIPRESTALPSPCQPS